MSEVAHETPQEFWRPPSPLIGEEVIVREAAPAMEQACPRCGTEFLLGSHFCHTCGGRRPVVISPDAKADAAMMAGLWEQAVASMHSFFAGLSWSQIKFPDWLHYLHFHEIKSQIGLSTASLIAFLVGIGCIAGALLVGLLTAKTFVDWQAIQSYRIEWLLGATAAFVAGILLKKPSDKE